MSYLKNAVPGERTSLDKINKNSKSTESHQSGWSDDHVSISSSDYQTSSKINKTETSKSSDDLEKDHGNNYVIMTSWFNKDSGYSEISSFSIKRDETDQSIISRSQIVDDNGDGLVTNADDEDSASHLPTQLASSGSMDLIENEFQFLKDYDSSGLYRGFTY